MASLGEYEKQKGIKYFLVSFVDLFGTLRAKLHGLQHIYVHYLRTPPAPEVIRLYDPFNNRECRETVGENEWMRPSARAKLVL